MKIKRPHILWTALIAFGLFVFCLVILIYNSWPVYPTFKKEMATYEALHEALKKEADICLPGKTDVPFADTYVLMMDGRTHHAQPNGYYMSGNALLQNGAKVEYTISCRSEPPHPTDYELVYRDIGIQYFCIDGMHACQQFSFSLGDYTYYIEAMYIEHHPFTLLESDIKEEIRQQLLTRAQSMIDSYSDE